ncbi:MAG: CoA-transferase [Dehalococcoidales bacterium]|jgi:glutaconate CoA-transferase subunit A|nr:CoA-transferase [Dehalococcoidales bacterium]
MNKVMTMKEAVSENVKSGDILFVGGAGHGSPSAAIHEIVRQRIAHLTVVAILSNTTLLLGEGLVDKMITGFSVQDEERSYAYAKAKAMDRLPVFEEYSHFGVSLALFAGYMGVTFIPTRCQVGSDMLKYNENIKTIDCPFTGGKIGVVRAVVPDVGIIHVQRSDAEGNAQKWGSVGADQEGINASQKVIVTAEEIVDSDVIRRDPNQTIIPGFRVSAVVEQPWGALPAHLAGCYNADPGFMAETGRREGYEAYVEKFVYGVSDWDEYLTERKASKGEDYLDKLRMVNPAMSDPIPTGRG